jgi:hypothetical protein
VDGKEFETKNTGESTMNQHTENMHGEYSGERLLTLHQQRP